MSLRLYIRFDHTWPVHTSHGSSIINSDSRQGVITRMDNQQTSNPKFWKSLIIIRCLLVITIIVVANQKKLITKKQKKNIIKKKEKGR